MKAASTPRASSPERSNGSFRSSGRVVLRIAAMELQSCGKEVSNASSVRPVHWCTGACAAAGDSVRWMEEKRCCCCCSCRQNRFPVDQSFNSRRVATRSASTLSTAWPNRGHTTWKADVKLHESIDTHTLIQPTFSTACCSRCCSLEVCCSALRG